MVFEPKVKTSMREFYENGEKVRECYYVEYDCFRYVGSVMQISRDLIGQQNALFKKIALKGKSLEFIDMYSQKNRSRLIITKSPQQGLKLEGILDRNCTDEEIRDLAVEFSRMDLRDE